VLFPWSGRIVESPRQRLGTFRTRTVYLSGLIDALFGMILVASGIGVDLAVVGPKGLPIGLTIGALGALAVATGVGRMMAKLEVHETSLVWTWWFSKHELSLAELIDAALVEKGAPVPGGGSGGFIGGGIDAVIAYWLVSLAASVFRTSPTMGTRCLIVIKRHGPRVPILAIGTWRLHDGHSQAADALDAVQHAIATFQTRSKHRVAGNSIR
jgi:hypothetical protein